MAEPTPAQIEALAKNHLISRGLVDVARLAVALRRQGYTVPEIHKAILAMDRAGIWELHADTGIGGKFTREELEAVPPGPRGMHLTSARVLRSAPPAPALAPAAALSQDRDLEAVFSKAYSHLERQRLIRGLKRLIQVAQKDTRRPAAMLDKISGPDPEGAAAAGKYLTTASLQHVRDEFLLNAPRHLAMLERIQRSPQAAKKAPPRYTHAQVDGRLVKILNARSSGPGIPPSVYVIADPGSFTGGRDLERGADGSWYLMGDYDGSTQKKQKVTLRLLDEAGARKAAEKAKKTQGAADKKSEAPFRKDYLARIEKYRKILTKAAEKAAKEIPPAAELKKAPIGELDEWAKELWELIQKKGLTTPDASSALRKQRYKLQYTRGMRDAKSSTENMEPLPWQIKNAMEYGLPIPGDPAATEAAYRKGFADGVAKRPRSMATKKKIAKILAIEKRLQKTTGRKPEATRAELLKQPDEQIAYLLDMIEEIETLADQKAKREKNQGMATKTFKQHLESHGVFPPYKNTSTFHVNGKNIQTIFPNGIQVIDDRGNKGSMVHRGNGVSIKDGSGSETAYIGTGPASEIHSLANDPSIRIVYSMPSTPTARSTKKPRTKKPAAMAAPSAAEKAAEKEAKAKAREAEKASKAAEKAREKAAEKARKAAEKAAQKTATQAEKAKAREGSRLARKEAKRARELAATKVNQAARSAVIVSEIKQDKEEWEEWEKIPFTMEALLAASPGDARKLLGIAGRSQKAAIVRQLRGEIKTLQGEIRALKIARKQRAKVIRQRCRDAAKEIRDRMKKLREEFLRAWRELQAENQNRRASCSADLSQVFAEIGPAIASVQGRREKIRALMAEIRQSQAAGKKPLTPEQIKKRQTAADKLQQSDALVARDLAHHMANVFPAAELWWEKKGKFLPSLKPGKIPEKASRSEAVMHYVENHIEDLQQFLEDDALRELKAKEKAERDKQKVLAKMAGKQSRRRIQRGIRGGRMAGTSRSREAIDARRRRFLDDAPF